ncbi:unnamed protein product [Amoebophrya sp. A25]|nr:unnamed protein product [Amoebophrya sp. A25]|eukprot:GSA25T00019591001.1
MGKAQIMRDLKDRAKVLGRELKSVQKKIAAIVQKIKTHKTSRNDFLKLHCLKNSQRLIVKQMNQCGKNYRQAALQEANSLKKDRASTSRDPLAFTDAEMASLDEFMSLDDVDELDVSTSVGGDLCDVFGLGVDAPSGGSASSSGSAAAGGASAGVAPLPGGEVNGEECGVDVSGAPPIELDAGEGGAGSVSDGAPVGQEDNLLGEE